MKFYVQENGYLYFGMYLPIQFLYYVTIIVNKHLSVIMDGIYSNNHVQITVICPYTYLGNNLLPHFRIMFLISLLFVAEINLYLIFNSLYNIMYALVQFLTFWGMYPHFITRSSQNIIWLHITTT